jgi:hypothetical protein
MSGGRRKTKDRSGLKPICFEKGLKWRPGFSGGGTTRAYSLLKPRHFENQASEHNNRHIDM